MRPFDDDPLTEDERLREVAKILAAGVLRLRLRASLPSSPAHDPASEIPGNSSIHVLESSPAHALIHHAD